MVAGWLRGAGMAGFFAEGGVGIFRVVYGTPLRFEARRLFHALEADASEDGEEAMSLKTRGQ